MDLCGPGIDVKLKERKKERTMLKETTIPYAQLPHRENEKLFFSKKIVFINLKLLFSHNQY